jgi:isopropylmalate/homocitrate/citramalate synthase
MVMEEVELYKDLYPFVDLPRIVLGGGDGGGMYGVPSRIYLTDTTLRDGQQGWRNLTFEESVRIYELLVELGGDGVITTCEVFLYTEKDRRVAKALLDLNYRYPKVIGWIRASLDDLRLVIDNGLDETVILTSISDYHIYYKLGLTRDLAISKYLSVVEEALKRGISVKCALEDITRASLTKNVLPFIRKLMRLREKYSIPVRIKLSDTLGLGLPFPEVPPPRGIPSLIRTLISEGFPGEDIEFHGHNDFGLVVANHLAAWIYGAGGSNCTLLGIGERSGNCPLEVMLIHYLGLRRDKKVNLRSIKKVAEFFTEIGFRIPEFQPVVGSNAFRTKAGIHVDGLMKNPEVYLPYDTDLILGIPYTISITPYSGRSAIAYWINTYFRLSRDEALSKDDPRVNAIYEEVQRIFSEGRKDALNDDEMLAIVRKYIPELVEGRSSSVGVHG